MLVGHCEPLGPPHCFICCIGRSRLIVRFALCQDIGTLQSPGAAPHLLIVDDEATLRGLMAERLAERGFEVVQADSGERALELLEQFAFDIVITDLRLPGIDGSRVIEAARESASSGRAGAAASRHSVSAKIRMDPPAVRTYSTLPAEIQL